MYKTSNAARKKVDDAVNLDILPVLAEVAFQLKRPVQAPDDSIGQSIDINGDISVNLGTPGREDIPVVIEAVDRLFAHISDEVYCRLEVKILLVHDNGDHVMSIALALLHVVGKKVLRMNHQ